MNKPRHQLLFDYYVSFSFTFRTLLEIIIRLCSRPSAVWTKDLFWELNFNFFSIVHIFKFNIDLQINIRTFWSLFGVSPKVCRDIWLFLYTFFSTSVILFPFFFISKNLINIIYLLILFSSFCIPRVLIWMILQRELFISFLDFFLWRVSFNSQDFIKVSVLVFWEGRC